MVGRGGHKAFEAQSSRRNLIERQAPGGNSRHAKRASGEQSTKDKESKEKTNETGKNPSRGKDIGAGQIK